MRTQSRALLAAAGIAMSVATLTACGGSSTPAPKAVATVPVLSGKDTAVALDSGFVDALTTLKLTPGVVGDASLADGSISFPITGGDVTYYKPGTRHPYVTGDIRHAGSGLSLTSGATKVDLIDFDIDPANSKLYGNVMVNGKSAAKHALIFNLNGSTLKPLKTGPGNTAVLQGTTVHMSKVAAGLLNKTFGTTAVKPGLLIGVATITINTK